MGKEGREGGNVCTEETLPELWAVERRVVLRFVMRRFNNCELGYFPSPKQNQLKGEIGVPFRESGDNCQKPPKNMSGLVLWMRATSGGKFPFTSRAMCRLAVGPWMNPSFPYDFSLDESQKDLTSVLCFRQTRVTFIFVSPETWDQTFKILTELLRFDVDSKYHLLFYFSTHYFLRPFPPEILKFLEYDNATIEDFKFFSPPSHQSPSSSSLPSPKASLPSPFSFVELMEDTKFEDLQDQGVQYLKGLTRPTFELVRGGYIIQTTCVRQICKKAQQLLDSPSRGLFPLCLKKELVQSGASSILLSAVYELHIDDSNLVLELRRVPSQAEITSLHKFLPSQKRLVLYSDSNSSFNLKNLSVLFAPLNMMVVFLFVNNCAKTHQHGFRQTTSFLVDPFLSLHDVGIFVSQMSLVFQDPERNKALERALKDAKNDEPLSRHLFTLALTASRGTYEPARNLVKEMQREVEQHNIKDVFRALCFLRSFSPCKKLVSPNLYNGLSLRPEFGSAIRFSLSETLFTATHPLLCRLYLEETEDLSFSSTLLNLEILKKLYTSTKKYVFLTQPPFPENVTSLKNLWTWRGNPKEYLFTPLIEQFLAQKAYDNRQKYVRSFPEAN